MGTSLNGLEAIRVSGRRFVNNHENLSHIYNPKKHLLLLLENWPEYGTMVIKNGYSTKFKKNFKTTPQSIIEWFDTRIFWDLRICRKVEFGVPEKIYNMNQSSRRAGLWPVHIVSEPKVAKKTKPQKSSADMCMQKMSKRLKKHPESCPNCLEIHEPSYWPDLISDARNYLAAYTVADYEAQTSQTRPIIY